MRGVIVRMGFVVTRVVVSAMPMMAFRQRILLRPVECNGTNPRQSAARRAGARGLLSFVLFRARARRTYD